MNPYTKIEHLFNKLSITASKLSLKFLLLLFVFTTSFVIDRLTKSIVTSLVLKSKISGIVNFEISLLPFFNIVFVINDGVSFGMFAGLGAKYYLIVLSIAISAILFYLMIKEKLLVNNIAYCLILSGALGNLFDRISIGGVIDFLDFYATIFTRQYHWPAFNIADSSIFIGVLILFLSHFFYSKQAQLISLPEEKNQSTL